jgi:hypothetical protein
VESVTGTSRWFLLVARVTAAMVANPLADAIVKQFPAKYAI